MLALDKEDKRVKTSTGFESAKGWACQCVPEGKGPAARIRKTPVLLTLALTRSATTHNQQTLPHLGGERGGCGPWWHCSQNEKCGCWQPYQRP